jgi:D-amino-acid dehydrogenase
MTPDVLVIGGGAVGITAAYELARQGASVTVIEREAELGLGCSAGAAGLIAPSHAAPLANPTALREGIVWMTRRDSPFSIHPRPQLAPWLLRFTRAALDRRRLAAATALLQTLSRDSLRLHCQLADGGIDTTLARSGVIYAYETESGFTRACAELSGATALGLTAHALGPADARALEPALAERLAGAVYVEEEAYVDSLVYVQAIGRAAAAAGADIRPETEALYLRTRGGRVTAVVTTRGELTVGTVLLASGVWSRGLAAQVGLSMPLEAAKGYHVELGASPGDPRIPVLMQEARVVATPYPGRLRLAGTLELAGLDASVSEPRIRALREAGARNLRGVVGRPTLRVWRGFRPTPPDGLPLIGWSRRVSNLMVATGHAMTGVALAPVTARITARLLAGRPPNYELDLVDPDRFTRRVGRVAPLGPRAAPRHRADD